ncbi:MAG: LamG domain-containing protein, partial [Anaerolineae bacterium]
MTDLRFNSVQSINHNGTVIVFGESTGSEDCPHKLWYKVLDLEQVADADNPNVWDDNTRWTDWMQVPYPSQLRSVTMSMLTVDLEVGDDVQITPGCWRVLSDGSNVYLFRAIDVAGDKGWTASPALLTGSPKGESGVEARATDIRVYANRYTLLRDTSPAGGTNRGASGKEITVPQLKPVHEARYRRSGMRETPQSDLDGQGFLDMGSELFVEPTIEFSMVTPVDGRFTVTLAPSSVPGRKRWQFFWKESNNKIAALSLLRDEGGWVDLEDKYDFFNSRRDPFHLWPDRFFTITHPSYDAPLELIGRPDSIMFRSQEESSGLAGDKEQMVSPERVLLAARFRAGDDEPLVVVDFGLDDDGIVDIPKRVDIGTVDLARTALHLNGETDRVVMPDTTPDVSGSMSLWAWVRHNGGKGALVERGYDPEKGQGFAIEWRPGQKKLVAALALENDPNKVIVQAPMPTSHTWHHIALVVDGDSDKPKVHLYIDGALAGEKKLPEGASFSASGEMVFGGPSAKAPERNWLDFEIDQVVLWGDARPPSNKTMYRELDEAELDEEALLGCWQMDDAHAGDPDVTLDSSPRGNHARVEGADHVNQTAPIFKPTAGDFEDKLGGLSVGMGLVSLAEERLVGDPTLFLSSDGLVHLYTSAQPVAEAPGARTINARLTRAEAKVVRTGIAVVDELIEAEIAARPKAEAAAPATEETLPELVVLQYDTTCTRAQFRFEWQATIEATGSSEKGEIILAARASGPIMNRTQVALQEDGAGLKLVIENSCIGLTETWTQLPRKVVGLIEILNGRASVDPADEAVEKGDKVYYDYASNVRYNGGPLPGIRGAEGEAQ